MTACWCHQLHCSSSCKLQMDCDWLINKETQAKTMSEWVSLSGMWFWTEMGVDCSVQCVSGTLLSEWRGKPGSYICFFLAISFDGLLLMVNSFSHQAQRDSTARPVALLRFDTGVRFTRLSDGVSTHTRQNKLLPSRENQAKNPLSWI